MDQLPICLNLAGRKVVVAGEGEDARIKIEMALKAGAEVLALADSPSEVLASLSEHPRLTIRTGPFEPTALDAANLVYAASQNPLLNDSVASAARQRGKLLNELGKPAASDFTMPSILDRSPVVIAISSGGTSPLLSRLLRQRLEASIPASFGRLADFLARMRGSLQAAIPDIAGRRRLLETALDGTIADLVLAGDEARARRALEAEVASYLSSGTTRSGEVYLVGAGPGDPDLLTFRALRLMQRADVVVYDRLVGEAILHLVRRDAERIYVGKRRSEHTLPQEDIGRLLVDLARAGKRVLRLKGGDPFIFGRGGEEIEQLAAAGLPFQIVPGVTAASGCACFAGIPLTHRDHAQACIFVTGHTKTGRLSASWSSVLQPNQTVVIYMGLGYLGELMADFLANGADPAMPVAVVENGTRPEQRVVVGTIADIAGKVVDAGVSGPSLTIIGTVVRLREKLAWVVEQEASDVPAVARLGSGLRADPPR
ncbi:MAG: siroheme synthase CysG [Hyphomicrobiaceae bacterium]|nr:siroheme synthase CysG [Hyphomicrobiaceae bacterium]